MWQVREKAAAFRRDGPSVYLAKDGLCDFTIPREWAHPDSTWIRSRAASGQDPRVLAATLRERLDLVCGYARERIFRAICMTGAVDRWLDEGLDALDVQPPNGVPASASERIARVRNTIQLIEELPGFELGLWDSREDGPLPAAYWQVHANHTVFVTGWHVGRSGQPEPSHQRIFHPDVAAAFRLHFEQFWARMPVERRSKTDVSSWLQARLREYQHRIASRN
jgi:hypothetical protein